MMRATVVLASQGIYEHIPTEDVVGYVQRERSILAWAIDGASTLTAAPYNTFHDVTDAGWFARQLDQRLRAECQDVPFSKALLHRILRSVREEYVRAGGLRQPLWAWPSAAALCVEMCRAGGQIEMSIFRYADCFIETCHATDLREEYSSDPAQNTPEFDPWKPFSGFRGQKLASLWRRRMQQQMNLVRNALTINPASAMNAVEEQGIVSSPVHVLLGSDGLSRIWDTYHVMTKDEAMRFVVRQGLHALLRKLREFESNSRTGVDSKRRDDASGLHIFLT